MMMMMMMVVMMTVMAHHGGDASADRIFCRACYAATPAGFPARSFSSLIIPRGGEA